MKYRLLVLKPNTSTGDFGDDATEWEEVKTIHAELVKRNGNLSEQVGEHFPDYHVEYNINEAHDIEENWRVKQLGGFLYNVTNIVPNIDKGMKTLICERVNE